MSPQNRPSLWSGFMTNNWSVLIATLSMFVLAIIFCLSYLLLGDSFDDLTKHQKLSPEEIEKYNKRADARLAVAHQEANWDKIVDGIHVRSGFYADPNMKTVIAACTSCHSSKLVTQNRATRSGWESMIRWMQATQGLPDLGENEPVILDYLAKYYAPKAAGRRANLDIKEVEWYILEL